MALYSPNHYQCFKRAHTLGGKPCMSELIVAVPVTVSYRASCCAAGLLCHKHRAVHTGMGLSPALTQLNPEGASAGVQALMPWEG